MPLNCTDGGAAICEFPYRFDNATSGCVSAADLLGDAFTTYNLAFAWASALLLFSFLRSWLFNLRERKWHFVRSPSVIIPLLCTVAQFLALIEATNLHLLRWSTRTWASLSCALFIPCIFSALLVHFDGARPRPKTSRGLRRLYKLLFHVLPWTLGLALSVLWSLKMPGFASDGASYVYIVPFVLVLAADMAYVAWTLRAARDHRRLRHKLIGLCSLLGLLLVYLTMQGISLLLGAKNSSSIPMPATFPFERMPVPIAKVAVSTLAWFRYGRPRASDQSRYVDSLTLVAAHVSVLAGLIATGFVVATAEAFEAVFVITATVVPALFVAALGAQLLRAGPLLDRSEDDTAALIAQCKANLSRARSPPVVVKQLCTGWFLVSLSIKMGPARHDAGGPSMAAYGFQVLGMPVELEGLSEWAQERRHGLSIATLAAYAILFGSFVLLRLAPMPRGFLVATATAWRLLYDLFLISAMRFVMKGLKCDGGKLVLSEHVPCDLGYAHREATLYGFMA